MNRTWKSVTIGVLLVTARGWAHHAFAAEYDETKLVAVSGTVAKLEWTNPHAWLTVTGQDDHGAAVTWRFEMGSPAGLLHRGWKRNDLKEGDRVSVDGFAAKDGSNVANARTVTLPSGRELFGGFQSTPGAPQK